MIGREELAQRAKKKEAENKIFFKRLKRTNPKDLDVEVKALHAKVFETTDCLECANCCKSISPALTDKDVERMAKHEKMRPAHFTEQYLHTDHDGDYVFNSSPCPFLMNDNYCSIYNARPKSCAGYPHTDRKHFVQILELTLKNTFICPAAFVVVELLKKSYSH